MGRKDSKLLDIPPVLAIYELLSQMRFRKVRTLFATDGLLVCSHVSRARFSGHSESDVADEDSTLPFESNGPQFGFNP